MSPQMFKADSTADPTANGCTTAKGTPHAQEPLPATSIIASLPQQLLVLIACTAQAAQLTAWFIDAFG